MANKPFLLLTALTLAVSAGVVIPPGTLAHPSSESATSSSGLLQKQLSNRRRLRFPLQRVRPTRSMIGGISRSGSCFAAGTPVLLTPLSPRTDPTTRTLEVESTVATHPTVFVYVPPSQARSAEFTLKDESGGTIYEAVIPLPQEPGVVRVQVPETAPALVNNQTYEWSLMLMCSEDDLSANPLAGGWVQRVALDATQSRQLAATSPRDRPGFYAESGLWWDALASLAELRLSSPRDTALNQDWLDLLSSVPMQEVALSDAALNALLNPEQIQVIAQAPLLDGSSATP